MARASVETVADFTDADPKAQRWLAELKLYDREAEKWFDRGDAIVKRYRDDRDLIKVEGARRKFSILWANIQTLQPAILARLPEAAVTRRFKDNDPVARVAAEIAERVLSYLMSRNGRFWGCSVSARDDYLLPGLGVMRQRYSVENSGEEGSQVIVSQDVVDEYVHWKDFFRTPGARTWEEVTAVGFRSYLTRDELVTRFGAEKGEKVPLSHSADHAKDGKDNDQAFDLFKKAAVWEIWDRSAKEVIWVCKGYPDILDVRPDPLNLIEFFPCPRPLMATTTTDTLVPVPDYCMYQDQAEEIDELTGRIANIVRAIKARGLYAGTLKTALEQMFSESNELDLIPIDDIAVLTQLGGIDKAVYFAPIDMMIKVVEGLYQAREKAKQDAYEITGLSDIMRGQVDPNEKLGQSEIKERWGSIRVKNRQDDMAKFMRDSLCIKFEIAFSQFEPQRLLEMANAENFPLEDQQHVLPALQMLQDSGRRYFEIDIETDSTIQPNAAAEQKQRVEFLGAVGTFLTNATPVLEAAPHLAPMMGELLMFGVRGFRVAGTLEAAIENGMKQLSQMGPQPGQPPPPDPAVVKAQSDADLAQKQQQHDQGLAQAKTTADGAAAAQKLQNDHELALRAADMKEHEALQQIERDRRKLESDIAIATDAHNVKMRIMEADAAAQRGREDTQAAAKQRSDTEAAAKPKEPAQASQPITINMPRAGGHRLVNDPKTGKVVGIEPMPEPAEKRT